MYRINRITNHPAFRLSCASMLIFHCVKRFLLAVVLLGVSIAFAQSPAGSMAFTVSIEQPATHSFHVTFRCDGLHGEIQDFKMPVWMPGFYGIQNYASYVSNFRAADAAGHALGWEKTTKNTWRVVTGNAPA